VRHVLEDVRQAVEDWPKMRTKALVVAAELEGAPPEGIDADETALAIRFLRWMADNHFTFLGYRDYTCARPRPARSSNPSPARAWACCAPTRRSARHRRS
jgi:NAD-specific glutamate dehydrogenase